MRRSTNEPGLALAVVASSAVRADRRRPAGITETLVQVHALGADGFEAILAEALPFDALGIVDAIEIRLAERRNVGLRTAQRKGTHLIQILVASAVRDAVTLYSETGTGFHRRRARDHLVHAQIRSARVALSGAVSQFRGFTNNEKSVTSERR